MIMAVPATVVLVMFLMLFIVLGGFFPFHINSALSFDIIRTACVEPDAYPWWRRQIAIYSDIYIWGGGKTRRKWKTGIGLIEG